MARQSMGRIVELNIAVALLALFLGTGCQAYGAASAASATSGGPMGLFGGPMGGAAASAASAVGGPPAIMGGPIYGGNSAGAAAAASATGGLSGMISNPMNMGGAMPKVVGSPSELFTSPMKEMAGAGLTMGLGMAQSTAQLGLGSRVVTGAASPDPLKTGLILAGNVVKGLQTGAVAGMDNGLRGGLSLATNALKGGVTSVGSGLFGDLGDKGPAVTANVATAGAANAAVARNAGLGSTLGVQMPYQATNYGQNFGAPVASAAAASAAGVGMYGAGGAAGASVAGSGAAAGASATKATTTQTTTTTKVVKSTKTATGASSAASAGAVGVGARQGLAAEGLAAAATNSPIRPTGLYGGGAAAASAAGSGMGPYYGAMGPGAGAAAAASAVSGSRGGYYGGGGAAVASSAARGAMPPVGYPYGGYGYGMDDLAAAGSEEYATAAAADASQQQQQQQTKQTVSTTTTKVEAKSGASSSAAAAGGSQVGVPYGLGAAPGGMLGQGMFGPGGPAAASGALAGGVRPLGMMGPGQMMMGGLNNAGAAAASVAGSPAQGIGMMGSGMLAPMSGAGAASAASAAAGGSMGLPMGAAMLPNGPMGLMGSAGSALGAAGAASAVAGGAAASASAASAAAPVVSGVVAPVVVKPSEAALGQRLALAANAAGSAQQESAIAGADMIAHGLNNAKSASLASNAYREAKLASARDRVNIAGTIQNTARISDAAIATHDASAKAEDSLLGSELAVDSAATVLDSDAAYIPPVTNSLLRSLPYGRIGIRNIVPKPLTYPSHLLPDVWLNGQPVKYLNVNLRQIPYGMGAAHNLLAVGYVMSTGQRVQGQPFFANNAILINDLEIDPAKAYFYSLGRIVGGTIVPILVNGQMEAMDETAMGNMMANMQKHGVGWSTTYEGYGQLNLVPMLTGSVNEATLVPVTTEGTTYPIGSALVIEPRDSFFQDYIDNASSRQNYDERQQ